MGQPQQPEGAGAQTPAPGAQAPAPGTGTAAATGTTAGEATGTAPPAPGAVGTVTPPAPEAAGAVPAPGAVGPVPSATGAVGTAPPTGGTVGGAATGASAVAPPTAGAVDGAATGASAVGGVVSSAVVGAVTPTVGAVEAGGATGTEASAVVLPRPAGASVGRPALRVGMVGYAFMGAAHSQGWRTAGRVFDLPLNPVLAAICGRDADAVRAAADRHGWAAAETDWRALIARDDVDLVDICTPGDSHAEIALAALAAGKHVLCEKPLANTVAEAEAMTRAADEAAARGQLAMVGFNYRRVPATALARRMVAEGRIGRLRHVRVTYLQDWLVDPEAPLTWRLRKELAGSGALGDLGAHIVDLAQYLTGEKLAGVSALTETFVRRRPLPAGAARGLTAGSADGTTGEVTVDDAAVFTGRFPSGALASFEATRYATGRKNALRIELNGEHGSLAFDLERLNELAYHDGTEPGEHAGFRRILVTEPEHPYLTAWWPPGHGLGYEHTFVHQARDLVHAVADGRRPEPSFADGLQVQRVLAAVEESAQKNSVYTPIAP